MYSIAIYEFRLQVFMPRIIILVFFHFHFEFVLEKQIIPAKFSIAISQFIFLLLMPGTNFSLDIFFISIFNKSITYKIISR